MNQTAAPATTPKRSRLVSVLLLIIPIGLGGAWFAKREVDRKSREQLPPESADTRSAATAGIPVDVAPVTVRTVRRTIDVVGTLHAFEEVVIGAKVEGRVRRMVRDVSDRVKPGDVLFEIDSTDYEMAVRQADRSLKVELARLGLDDVPPLDFDVRKVPSVKQAALRFENAKTKYERLQTAGVAVPADELRDRLNEYQVFGAELETQILLAKSIVATVQMKQESLAMSKQQLVDTKVRVPEPTRPVPGESGPPTYAVSHRMVAEGTFVRPGSELCRLVIDRTLKLKVPVPEKYSGDVRIGQSATVRTAGLPSAVMGTVSRINPVVETATRTFEVEIQVPNLDGKLKSGSFGKASIITRDQSEAQTVPTEAIVSFVGITKLYLMVDGKAKEVPVTTGIFAERWVEIAAPTLPKGARVIISGQTVLANETPVSVRSESKGAP